MSLPEFPTTDPAMTREDVINQIISSIAMEELGLSHIINAEGEKLQYALGTIPGVSGPEEPATIDDLLRLNDSIHKTLDSTMLNQFLLKDKLLGAFSSPVLQGPTGPTGPQGPATIAVDTTVYTLDPGEPATVVNNGTPENVLLTFGLPRGATGATPTVTARDTQTIDSGLDANVTSTATATGVALDFQIPRGATGATPTVTVGDTETIAPNLNANVTSTATATGIELDFQIPRGATGAVEASGLQAIVNAASGTDVEIATNGVVPFNQTVTTSGTDVTYNAATGTFTINATNQNNLYMINWFIFAEGSNATPVAFNLNVGGTVYSTATPWVEMQLSGSTLVSVAEGAGPINVTLTNNTGTPVTLPNINIKAQMTIVGFRRVT